MKNEVCCTYSKGRTFAAGFVGMFGNFEDFPDIAWAKDRQRLRKFWDLFFLTTQCLFTELHLASFLCPYPHPLTLRVGAAMHTESMQPYDAVKHRGQRYTCLISGIRREVDENRGLVGYYTARSGNSYPTFR